jgi:hypothetical protein
MNTLNYKRKNNIYNTHCYINTHVVGCGRFQTQLGVGHGRVRTRAPRGGGITIANRALCQDPSSRWRLGLPFALEPPKR